jgi:hypothetical protein
MTSPIDKINKPSILVFLRHKYTAKTKPNSYFRDLHSLAPGKVLRKQLLGRSTTPYRLAATFYAPVFTGRRIALILIVGRSWILKQSANTPYFKRSALKEDF